MRELGIEAANCLVLGRERCRSLLRLRQSCDPQTALDSSRASSKGAVCRRLVTPPFSRKQQRAYLHTVADRANSEVAVRTRPGERGTVGLDLARYRFPIPEQNSDAGVRQRACSSSIQAVISAG
jgi:hypothetical protein